MNRIDAVFQNLKRKRQKALILFATAGDPSMDITRQFLRYAEKAGVDCVELGVPFSDPLADGPVIQAASFRALGRGVSLDAILRLVRAERRRGLRIPIALMTSYNPVYRFGVKRAFATAKMSGVDGFIIPDLPYDEAGPALKLAGDFGVHLILMMTPTTTEARKKAVLRRGRGFIYYVSLKGVTGERERRKYPFDKEVRRLASRASAPVCVGFGISTPEQAADIARFAGGVIVGSAVVRDLDRYSKRGLSARSKAHIDSFARAVKKVRGKL